MIPQPAHATVKMWPHSPVVGFDRATQLLHGLPITGLTCTPGGTTLLARHLLAQGVDPAALKQFIDGRIKALDASR